MDTQENVDEAVEVLQQLGLKEYEARCFVGLTRVETGTAKQLSELTEVPRTRVYDAIRILESHGLVEIHHSSPQRYRAVSLEEAAETLRDQYESRVERFQDALDTVELVDEGEDEPVQQVWSMSGTEGIENRTEELIETASEEIVLVLGDETLLTENLVDTLNRVGDDVDLLVGAASESFQGEIRTAVPAATTFTSGLGWMHGEVGTEEDTGIGRLLMVDRTKILVSTVVPETGVEQAIYGDGFGNGLVVIARRLMSEGLLAERDTAA